MRRTNMSLWTMWLIWIGASVVAWIVAAITLKFWSENVLLILFDSYIVSAALATLILSVAQSFILSLYISGRIQWVWTSLLAAGIGGLIGAAVGVIVFVIIFIILSPLLDSILAALEQTQFSLLQVVLAAAGAAGGAIIGSIQRRCFRPRSMRVRRWATTWAVGSGLGLLLYMPPVLSSVVNGIVSGAVFGVVTGFALLNVLKTPPAPRVDQPPFADDAPVTA